MGYSDAYPGGYGAGGDLITSVFIEMEPDDWYDATADLISGSIRRGRQQELDRFQAGTCELLLDNDDRTYDPDHAASPLNGYVRPMRRVKVTATWAGTTYPLFAGYADRWTQNRDGPHRGTVSLQATDGFKILARKNLASSAYAQEVLADGPVAWWRLDEAAAASTVFDSVGTLHMAVVGAFTLGVDGLVTREAGTAGQFTDPDVVGGAWVGRPVLTAGLPMSLEFIMRADDIGGTSYGTIISQNDSNPFGRGFEVGLLTAGTNYMISVQIVSSDTSGSVRTLNGGYDYVDGLVHHVAVTWNAADNVCRIYVDGSEVATEKPGPDDGIILGNGNFASSTVTNLGGPLSYLKPYEGILDEVAVYDQVLSAARIAAHAAQVTTPWDGDSPGERIDRVLDAVDWPAAARDLDDGTVTLLPADLAGVAALEHVQKVAESEFGVVYVTADGTLRFEERAALVNQTAVADFEDIAATGLGFATSSPELADDLLRNEVTVSRSEGVAQTVRDEDSIAEYLTASYVIDGLLHDDDTFSRAAAEFLVSEYGTPGQRVNSLTVNPYHDPEQLWPAVLGLELTDWVTVTETPQHYGDPWTKTLAVEGIGHAFGPKSWETVLDLSPAFGTGDGDDCILELNTGPCGLDDARLWF